MNLDDGSAQSDVVLDAIRRLVEPTSPPATSTELGREALEVIARAMDSSPGLAAAILAFSRRCPAGEAIAVVTAAARLLLAQFATADEVLDVIRDIGAELDG